MSRRQVIGIGVLVAFAIGFALPWLAKPDTDGGTLVVSIAVLIVATITLFYVVPRPADIRLDRMDELGVSDLIFYIYPTPPAPPASRIPRDFLIQVHVALSNAGGRKAVVSSTELERFLNSSGEPVALPEVPLPLQAAQAVLRSGWVQGRYESQILNIFPPYTLEPDDVIAIRFRARRGIDWSPRWDLTALRAASEALSNEITQADFRVVFRRGGGSPEERRFRLPVSGLQQLEYSHLLNELTNGFSQRPQVRIEEISLE